MKSIYLPEKIPTLKTERLILRQLNEGDVRDYFEFCSDPDVMHTWGTKTHSSIEETQALIDLHIQNLQERKAIRWGIEMNGKIVGDIGFWRVVPERYRAEVGAKLGKPLWSNGYMQEAGSAIIDYGFEVMRLHSIEASIETQNIGAIKLVDKLGFQLEGTNREHSFCSWREKFIDTQQYAVLDHEWIGARRCEGVV